jgi:hypothetical protein
MNGLYLMTIMLFGCAILSGLMAAVAGPGTWGWPFLVLSAVAGIYGFGYLCWRLCVDG